MGSAVFNPGHLTERRSYSQASQDAFVLGVLGHGLPRYYLEIGVNDAFEGSNTALLESLGWEGFSVDKNFAKNWSQRKNPLCVCDAKMMPLSVLWRYPRTFDYLSLDVDDDNLEVLKSLPWNLVNFRVMTIEHNAYLDGGTVREAQREFLRDKNYVLVGSNIWLNSKPFEDWWLHESVFDEQRHPILDNLDHRDMIEQFFLGAEQCHSH